METACVIFSAPKLNLILPQRANWMGKGNDYVIYELPFIQFVSWLLLKLGDTDRAALVVKHTPPPLVQREQCSHFIGVK